MRQATDTYALVNVRDISLPEKLVRHENDSDHIAELANSMSRHGLLEPIIIKQKPDGGYKVVAGVHRTLAAQLLNWETIPAMIRPDEDQSDSLALAAVENIMRKQMTLREECNAVAFLYDQEKMSPSQICVALGKSRAWVDRRIMAPNLPEKIRDAMFEGLITVAGAEIIASVGDEGLRNSMLAEAIYARRTLSELRDLAKIYTDTPTLGEAVQAGIATQNSKEAQTPRLYECVICGNSSQLTGVRSVIVCAGGCPQEKQNA